MPTKTKIEWADYISNPIRATRVNGPRKPGHACVKLSDGCKHCWASRFNVRLGTGLEYTVPNLEKVNVNLDASEMARLLKFKPRGPFKNGRSRALVFPCDMTDLFGDWVPEEYLEQLFAAFEARADVDFLILTKRPQRMFRFLKNAAPLANVILGVSIENQTVVTSRWPPMFEISQRGWKTAVSYEPALGPVSWVPWYFISLLICGGESGPEARPMSLSWARAAREFCVEHNIPFFFKQMGEYGLVKDLVERGMSSFKSRPVNVWGELMVRVGKGQAGHTLDGVEWRQMPNNTNDVGILDGQMPSNL